MQIISDKLTESQNKDTNEALDYIIDTVKTQGKLLHPSVLFGDGSRWKTLTLKGFTVVHNAVKDALLEKGYLNLNGYTFQKTN